MDSRYLATVRRATSMPSAMRIRVSALSDKRFAGVLLGDQLADARADCGRGDAFAIAARHLAGEKITEFEHAAGRVHVLAGGGARDRGLVQFQRVGDFAQHERAHALPRRARGTPAGARRSRAPRGRASRCGSRGSSPASAPPATACAAWNIRRCGRGARIGRVDPQAGRDRRVDVHAPSAVVLSRARKRPGTMYSGGRVSADAAGAGVERAQQAPPRSPVPPRCRPRRRRMAP
jgi:hypothetical protein